MKRASTDVVVIGGGTAGLVAAAGCAALGARTALVERDRLGGECTWTGCVPSKALLHIARQAAMMRESASLGIDPGSVTIDFGEVMRAVRSTRREIYQHSESPEYLKQLGVRPLHATARFLDTHTLRIEHGGRQRELRFRSAIIATGSRPFIPDIPGLDSTGYLTTNELFEIDRLPDRLAILGGGAVAIEASQAFARLGSQVTIICRDDQLLAGVEPDASHVLLETLQAEGVQVRLRRNISSVSDNNGTIDISVGGDNGPSSLSADRLLIATGRAPNIEGLGLDAASVRHDSSGIEVDEYCRTNVRHILASGDITPVSNLTHAGENMSKVAAINAISRLPVWKHERKIIPYVIYTDPEFATVGRTDRELREAGIGYDVITLPYDRIDRAIIEHQAGGFVRLYHRRGRILGATIVGALAGELIAEYALAMRHGLSLADLSGTIHPYPTMILGARRAADQYIVRQLRRWMVKTVQLAYGYRGPIPDFVGTRQII